MAIKRKICPTDLDVFDTNENKIQCMSGKTILVGQISDKK